MKPLTKVILPPATPADWRWREYKGYLAICGDLVDCVIVGKVAVIESEPVAERKAA